MNCPVGLVLRMCGGRADSVVAAIRDDNPDTELQVLDHGCRIEVLAAHRLRLTKATLQWHLGRSYGLNTVESMMLGSTGTLARSGEEMVWSDPCAPGTDENGTAADDRREATGGIDT
jgi:toluene monooxygenase system protein D